MAASLVLSHYQVAALLEARALGIASAATSPDLGLTTVDVILAREFVEFSNGERLTWTEVEKIGKAENTCFRVENNSIEKIQVFSDATNRLCTLFPTPGAPTMLVSGVPMHRIKSTDPWADTLSKMKTIAPVVGHVLDTATGLGYTATVAARTAEHVLTIELDPAAIEIARLNPWSRALFEDPRIERIIGDSIDLVPALESETFSCVIHDPPMFNLGGELYSEEFYRELNRVMKRGGKLFHYTGNLESKSGRNVVKGVIRRLHQAGFTQVVPSPESYGVIASK